MLGCLGRGGSNPAVSECVCVASVGLLIELFRSLVVCKNGRGRGSVYQVDNVNVDMQRGRGSFHQVDNCHVLLGKHVGEGGFSFTKMCFVHLFFLLNSEWKGFCFCKCLELLFIDRNNTNRPFPPSLPLSVHLGRRHHFLKSSRLFFSLCFWILQVLKSWTLGRPGTEARYMCDKDCLKNKV